MSLLRYGRDDRVVGGWIAPAWTGRLEYGTRRDVTNPVKPAELGGKAGRAIELAR